MSGFVLSAKGSKKFETCPPLKGVKAVCVDVTPLEEDKGPFGIQQKFRFVFEVDRLNAQGNRFSVWSEKFTPSLHEKAKLRKFLRKWFGRELTSSEMTSLDPETLIGRPAELVVVNEPAKNDPSTVYANIALIEPCNSDALAPTGKFVRKKDRPARDSNYHRSEAAEVVTEDWQKTKVHVGKHSGQEVRSLSNEQLEDIYTKWLPRVESADKKTADDQRLIAALKKWKESQTASPAAEQDDVAY